MNTIIKMYLRRLVPMLYSAARHSFQTGVGHFPQFTRLLSWKIFLLTDDCMFIIEKENKQLGILVNITSMCRTVFSIRKEITRLC